MQAEKKLVAMPPWCTSEMTRVFIYYSNSSSGIGKAVALTMAMLQMRIATFQVVGGNQAQLGTATLGGGWQEHQANSQ